MYAFQRYMDLTLNFATIIQLCFIPTSLMLSGLPFRSCLFIDNIALFTNSSSLNSTTLLNQEKKMSPCRDKYKIRNIQKYLFGKNAQYLTHNPNQTASLESR